MGNFNSANNVASGEKLSLVDSTTNNVSTTKHGFAPKGDGDTSKFLNANGNYSVPSGLSSATTTTLGSSLLPKRIILSNNATDANNDIDFAAGNVILSDGSLAVALSSLMTKRLDAAWAAGTNQGGLDTGSKANSTTYSCFLIYDATTPSVDVIFTLGSNSAPSYPSGYTKSAYLGRILTDGSGNIRSFTQLSNKFFMRTMEVANVAPLNTNRFSLAATIPTGSVLEWFGSIYHSYSGSSGAVQSIFSSLANADIEPTSTNLDNEASAGSTYTNVWNDSIITNTSAQIGLRFNSTSARYYVTTRGWIDHNI